jgi:hypothetical protein
MYVLGELVTGATTYGKVGDKFIEYSINVATFSEAYARETDDLPPAVVESMRKKLSERSDFRNATLNKLGMKNEIRVQKSAVVSEGKNKAQPESTLEVINGKLHVLNAVYTNDPKEQYCLEIVDKYGDSYLLYDKQGKLKPFDKYKKYENTELVVIGEITLPDSSIQLKDKEEHIPFAVQKIYNEDLTEFVAK